MGKYSGGCRLVYPFIQRALLVQVVLLSMLISATAQSDESGPVDMAPAYLLLQRMADANKQLSYRGTFTYEYGGSIKTAKLAHMVKDGREYERLTHLSGPSREVIRRGNDIDCQRAGDKLLRGMIRLGVNSQSPFSDYYDLYIKGENRVAGRPVTVVHVVPRDQFRYGYALSLDNDTGLLLQTILIGQGKKVLERFQFVDIHVGVLIDESELLPAESDHYVAKLDHSPCIEDTEAPRYKGDWAVGWLPPGFVLTGEQKDQALQRTTLIFTDGLAVFSVFVDNDQQLRMPEVQAQRGATVAFLTRYESDGPNYSVGVVGEIPPATARRVAQSVRSRG